MIIRITYDFIFIAAVFYVSGFLMAWFYQNRRIKGLEKELKDSREHWAATTANLQQRLYEQYEKDGVI